MAKKLSLSPLGDRVLVRPFDMQGEKKLASGIIIPETVNKEKLLKGEIIAVGTGKRTETGERVPMEVKIGDIVYFKKPWDEPIKLDNVDHFVLSESELVLTEK
jgi:chaperonin GroES